MIPACRTALSKNNEALAKAKWLLSIHLGAFQPLCIPLGVYYSATPIPSIIRLSNNPLFLSVNLRLIHNHDAFPFHFPAFR